MESSGDNFEEIVTPFLRLCKAVDKMMNGTRSFDLIRFKKKIEKRWKEVNEMYKESILNSEKEENEELNLSKLTKNSMKNLYNNTLIFLAENDGESDPNPDELYNRIKINYESDLDVDHPCISSDLGLICFTMRHFKTKFNLNSNLNQKYLELLEENNHLKNNNKKQEKKIEILFSEISNLKFYLSSQIKKRRSKSSKKIEKKTSSTIEKLVLKPEKEKIEEENLSTWNSKKWQEMYEIASKQNEISSIEKLLYIADQTTDFCCNKLFYKMGASVMDLPKHEISDSISKTLLYKLGEFKAVNFN